MNTDGTRILMILKFWLWTRHQTHDTDTDETRDGVCWDYWSVSGDQGLSACKYLLLNVIQKTQHTDNDVRNSVIWCVVNSFRPKYCLLFTYNEKHPLFSWHQLTTHYLMLTKEAEVCLPSRSQLYNRCLVSPGRCWLVVYKFTSEESGSAIIRHPPTHHRSWENTNIVCEYLKPW